MDGRASNSSSNDVQYFLRFSPFRSLTSWSRWLNRTSRNPSKHPRISVGAASATRLSSSAKGEK